MARVNDCCDTCALISKVFGYIEVDEIAGTQWLYDELQEVFENSDLNRFYDLGKHENGEFLARVMKAQNHPIASFIEKVLKNRAPDVDDTSGARNSDG